MPPAPSVLRPDIPRELENVLLHALQKDPSYRYQSASDFRVALDHATAQLGPEAFAPFGEAGARVAVVATGMPLTASRCRRQGGYGAPMPTPVSPYAPVTTPYHGTPMPTPYPLPGYGQPMMVAPLRRSSAASLGSGSWWLRSCSC